MSLLVTELVTVPECEVSADARLRTDIAQPAPVLMILHGFKAFARWGFFPYFGEYFARRGFLTLVVNFSLNGTPHRMIPDSTDCAEPERFARNTVSQEVCDASVLLELISQHSLGTGTRWGDALSQWWNGDVYIVAHSRGGAVAWVLGYHFANIIRKIAALGTVSRLDRFTERAKQEWRSKGYMEVRNARTGQELRMDRAYLEDIVLHADKLEPQKTIARLCPPSVQTDILLVHGEQDMTVALSEAYELYAVAQQAGCRVQLVQIPHVGHTFGVTHPMTLEHAQQLPFRHLCSVLEAFFRV
ncbi:MAG: prolyl oligopeptidase family serine peptidase [Bacteroidota bacterium]|nr:prolyl oligopeptidase family serine peptidase [Candidatus Kapabacteria bacterium]MDW8221308.1 prolyl oligopeptidase family serine peptidase [Bacteroidota bacterium]